MQTISALTRLPDYRVELIAGHCPVAGPKIPLCLRQVDAVRIRGQLIDCRVELLTAKIFPRVRNRRGEAYQTVRAARRANKFAGSRAIVFLGLS